LIISGVRPVIPAARRSPRRGASSIQGSFLIGSAEQRGSQKSLTHSREAHERARLNSPISARSVKHLEGVRRDMGEERTGNPASTRGGLPRRINAMHQQGAEPRKEAKGLLEQRPITITLRSLFAAVP
jgi:hypothetical protein